MTSAFKEWSYIVDALGKGKQSIILRKGGIDEEGGDFLVKNKKFLLFPTLFHQASELIKPSWRDSLNGDRFQVDQYKISIEYFAEIADTKVIRDWITLKKLEDFHAWSEEVIREKFNRWQQSVHLMVVMVYKLPEPVIVEVKPAYTGCKSWIELEENIILEGTPVLNPGIHMG